MNRRSFVKAGTLAYAGTVILPHSSKNVLSQPGTIKKAVKFGMIDEPISVLEKFKLLKELGFDGVEPNSPSDLDEKEVIEAIKETGLPVHGLVDSVHWKKTFGDPDPAIREEGRAGLEHALKQAKAFGASTVLLVPAVVNKQISYADAYTRSQAEIRKVLPLAEELQIKIALENVWNNFLLSPLEYAQYIDAFDSPWIGAYFDVGNIVNYGWPEHWIRTLGHRILKLDIKEFSRQKRDDEGLWKGFGVELGEGDCDWPAVRQALKDIGYSGWATAEIRGGDTARLKDIAMRMDRILDT
ncbi:MAG: sugar phosphate isomerase/epimerase [Rhodothermaceae bacterium]|nr:sugar phosphate isomerase/epimerase [Rhodothermaceae bacterium]